VRLLRKRRVRVSHRHLPVKSCFKNDRVEQWVELYCYGICNTKEFVNVPSINVPSILQEHVVKTVFHFMYVTTPSMLLWFISCLVRVRRTEMW
jgi:hypothetical protein